MPAPATGLSMAWIYGAGLVFGASVIPLLLLDLIATVSGRRSDDELVIVRESEEDPHALESTRLEAR
jgi:TRAP-type C4-dicarboxylate transport system permease small subunit